MDGRKEIREARSNELHPTIANFKPTEEEEEEDAFQTPFSHSSFVDHTGCRGEKMHFYYFFRSGNCNWISQSDGDDVCTIHKG